MSNCNGCRSCDELQPYVIDLPVADGVAVKQVAIPYAHTLLPQHSHEYDHTTLVASGAVVVRRCDTKEEKELCSPDSIFIPAGVKHTFLTIKDHTVIYCIHNVSRSSSGEISVKEEHQLQLLGV